MILIFISAIVVIIFWGEMSVCSDDFVKKFCKRSLIASAIFLAGLCGVLAITLILGYNDLRRLPERRAYLVYQLQESENPLNNEELILDILKYNKRIRTNNTYHGDPWFGFANPVDLNRIEPIDLNEFIFSKETSP